VQLSPVWQLVTVDHVTQSAGTTLDFQVYDAPVVAGEVFIVDNISICIVPATTVALMSGAPGDSTSMSGLAGVPLSQEQGDALVTPLAFRAGIVPTVSQSNATLHFVTTRPGPVRAELYDAAGRRVRVLLDAAQVGPGVHQVPVDGRRDDGGTLGSGLYFYRLQAAERTATGRFVIVR
jgi:hypothetical protein